MTIKELEIQTGLERANIRFYEREGLISPARAANGYRDYSAEDAEVLLRVKLLRSLHISLEDILALREGKLALADALEEQIAQLEREQKNAAYAEELCRAMRADEVSFSNLDAKKYLERIERKAESSGAYFALEDGSPASVFHPWRRYLARALDQSLYSLLWYVPLVFVFQTNLLSRREGFASVVDAFVSLLLMLFLEPLLLNKFGTTPGKAIFGLSIRGAHGGFLSYGEAIERTWGVIGKGLGYGIPVFNLVRLWKSYKRCRNCEVQPWDEEYSYSMRDARAYRALVYLGAGAAAGFLTLMLVFSQFLPPNRGELTPAQFAENYNYYVRYFGYEYGTGYMMEENGAWTRTSPGGASTIYYKDEYAPVCAFTLKNGTVQGVKMSLSLDGEQNWVYPASYTTPLYLASLAFAGAQEENGLFSKMIWQIKREIDALRFDARSFTQAGAAFSYQADYQGYVDTGSNLLTPQVTGGDGGAQSFSMEYTIAKGN